MNKVLNFLWILQEKKVIVDDTEEIYFKFNPFNPLTYLLFISMLIISLPLYGLLGTVELFKFFSEMGISKPFQWF